jgi:hypothetical protein
MGDRPGSFDNQAAQMGVAGLGNARRTEYVFR